MASSSQHIRVDLNEDEVPGAALQSFKSVEGHSVTELKRWLQCRGLPVGGKKALLIERVKMCIQSGNTKIVPSIDNGHWYNVAKLNRNVLQNNTASNSAGVPLFPLTRWKSFPSRSIPKGFNYGIIYHHLIETAVIANSTNDQDSEEENTSPEFHTSKPLRKGRQFFKSGHVKDIQDNLTNSELHYCIKSKVLSSFRENVSYSVIVMLDKTSAKVLDSSCGCVASSLGRCNHIAALLFALEDYVISFGYEPVSRTSKLCEWNIGRGKKDPSAIMAKQYSQKIEPKLKSLYVPLELDEDMNTLNNKLVYELQSSNSNVTTMWELLLDFKYTDYSLSNDRQHELVILVENMKKNLTFGYNKPTELPGTNLQCDSERWKNIRPYLVTASECKKFHNVKLENLFSVVKDKLWYPKQINNKYTQHGRINEKFARSEYAAKTGNNVEETGLWINPKYFGLGASPDGLVYCVDSKSHGVLEIKCPFVLKDELPNDISKLTPAQRSAFCATVDVNGHLHLKIDHSYYFQIQMQLAIVERNWCDFVIWTSKGISIERVYFNKSFWDNVEPKLSEFYLNVLCPEYFEMRTPRNLPPFNLQRS